MSPNWQPQESLGDSINFGGTVGLIRWFGAQLVGANSSAALSSIREQQLPNLIASPPARDPEIKGVFWATMLKGRCGASTALLLKR